VPAPPYVSSKSSFISNQFLFSDGTRTDLKCVIFLFGLWEEDDGGLLFISGFFFFWMVSFVVLKLIDGLSTLRGGESSYVCVSAAAPPRAYVSAAAPPPPSPSAASFWSSSCTHQLTAVGGKLNSAGGASSTMFGRDGAGEEQSFHGCLGGLQVVLSFK